MRKPNQYIFCVNMLYDILCKSHLLEIDMQSVFWDGQGLDLGFISTTFVAMVAIDNYQKDTKIEQIFASNLHKVW